MATTFTGTGTWTEAAHWDGGLPENGEAATIAADAVCTFDDDLVADGVVLLSLTINGTLICSTTTGTYKLQCGGTIGGGAAGIFQAGTSASVPLPTDVNFEIILGAAGKFLGSSGLKVYFYCAQPEHPYCLFNAATLAGADTFYTDTDLTVAASNDLTVWKSGATLAICDIDKAQEYQGPGSAVAAQMTIDGAPAWDTVKTTVNILTNPVGGGITAAKLIGAYAFVCWRNIDIQFGTAGATATPNTSVFDTFTSAVLGCSIRPLGNTIGGSGLNLGTNCTASGTISGCINGFQYGTGHANSGTISGCTYGFRYGTGHANSGTISGCGSGFAYGSGNTNSGTISGCAYGFNSGSGNANSGTISGCGSGFSYGSGNTNSGTISGCASGLYFGFSYLIRGCVVGGSGAAANTRDIYNSSGEGCTLIIGYGAKLGSSSTFSPTSGWKRSVIPVSQYNIGVFLYDVPATTGGTPQIGQVECWMPGGQVYSQPHTSAPSTGRPTVTDNFFHYVAGQDGTAPVFLDQQIYGYKDVPLNFSIHFYDVASAGGWTTPPQFQIVDPNYAFNVGGDAILAHSHPSGTEDAWEVITLTYTPTVDRMLTLRFIATANSATNAQACWFRCLTVAPTWPAAANVWYGTGGYGPLNTTYTPAMRASNIDVTGGAGAHLTAPDVKSGVTVDDVEGSATGGGSVIVCED
jgi:hypothetical protein